MHAKQRETEKLEKVIGMAVRPALCKGASRGSSQDSGALSEKGAEAGQDSELKTFNQAIVAGS
jgi:hypothetical protein